jgi:hypothetical protein
MASGGERRMLFDTRGRRKHVIRVVYAILAILMGASLLLVVGPVNIGALLGTQSSSSSAAQVFDEQAERIERRLARNPTDEAELLALTRARINAGNAQVEVTEGGETQTVPASAREDFEAGLQAWNRYLKQAGGEPSAPVAQLIAGSFFRLAESSTSLRQAEADIAKATAAQEVAAEQRPNLGSLSTLAIYQYFNGEFAAADKTAKQAAAKAPSKAEAKSVENQLTEFRKRGKQLQKQKKQLAKAEREAGAGNQGGTNPFGGFGGAPAGE